MKPLLPLGLILILNLRQNYVLWFPNLSKTAHTTLYICYTVVIVKSFMARVPKNQIRELLMCLVFKWICEFSPKYTSGLSLSSSLSLFLSYEKYFTISMFSSCFRHFSLSRVCPKRMLANYCHLKGEMNRKQLYFK